MTTIFTIHTNYLQSTLRLAQTSKGIRNILQGGLVWRQLLARTSPIRRVSQVKNVCGILKLLKDIEYHLHTVKNEIIREILASKQRPGQPRATT